MSIYVIGDLHLSFQVDKPMDVFGNNWENHVEKIKQNWINKVNNEDTVILPGDFSWGMNLEDTVEDFKFLSNLPGKKILLKGNHDYWWTTVSKMNKFLKDNNFENIYFLQNDSYFVEDVIITGTRGWVNTNSEENYKIQRRECERLKLSIEDGIRKFGLGKEIITFFHYPPFYKDEVPDEINYIKILNLYNIKRCYYAHLHSDSHKEAIEGYINGIDYSLVSSDYLKFDLKKIK